MNIDRMTFEIYWSYYISIEKMLINTIQYVAPSNENKDTYSDEFAKIILLSCSEIDSILKLLCKLNGINLGNKQYNMFYYAKILEIDDEIKETTYAPGYVTTIDEKFLTVTPFKNVNSKLKYGGLKWWENYQLLKHDRMKNAKKGSLNNALFSLSAHYILMRLLMNYLNEYSGADYVKEHNVSNFLIPCV